MRIVYYCHSGECSVEVQVHEVVITGASVPILADSHSTVFVFSMCALSTCMYSVYVTER
jgi:hypothetical protein